LAPKLLPHFPQHTKYVEVFFGGGAVFFKKEPSPVEVINDIDGDVHNLYFVLRHQELFSRFKRLAEATLHCRGTFNSCRQVVDTPFQAHTDEERVNRAWMFFVRCRQAYSGKPRESWRYDHRGSARGMGKTTADWWSAVKRLPHIHARLRTTTVENDDFESLIKRHDRPESFFYLDPPYVTATRTHKKEYRHEMTDDDHRRLVKTLLRIKGMAALSGYAERTAGGEHGLYRPLEDAGWHRASFDVSCHSATPDADTGKKPTRTEVLWRCPKTMEKLEESKRLGASASGKEA